MLTEEQIKKLKDGDHLIAEVAFKEVNALGDILGWHPHLNPEGIITCNWNSFHPCCLSLPPAKPKHDPNRLFKKGDIAEVIDARGRDAGVEVGTQVTVMDDEYNELVSVKVNEDFSIVNLPIFHLELVTPVEELEPYFVLDSPHTFNICKHGGSKFAATFYKDQPLAREHADKYCAALNAEYRKEQQ